MSKSKPTETGWYWYIATSGFKGVVQVEADDRGLFAILFDSGECSYRIRVEYSRGTWGPRVEEWIPS